MDNQILQLHKQGHTIREIASKIKMSKSQVHRRLKRMRKNDVYKVLVLPDPHVPAVDERSVKALEKYMADTPFDEWLCLGDLNHFQFLFKLDKTYLKTIEEHTFDYQYKKSNEFLDRQQELILRNNPRAKFTLIEGNHDIRPNAFMEVHTETAGLLGAETQLELAERNIQYVKHWTEGEIYKIGKAAFIHGHTTSKYHAAKAVSDFGCNIFYGHTHDVQQYSLVKYGDNDTIVGQSLGCLCEYNPPYMRGRPSKWQQAFAVFYFFDDGHFSYYIARFINHSFVSPEGRVYRG